MSLALFVTHTVHLLSFGRRFIPILWGNNSNLIELPLLFLLCNAVLSLMITNRMTAVCQPRSDHKQQYKQADTDLSRYGIHQCRWTPATAQLMYRRLARQALQPCSLSVCCRAALVQARQMICLVQPFWQSVPLKTC